MRRAVVVDAVRTPMGRRNGGLSGWHPVDLAATCLEALVDRNAGGAFEPGLVDDVILGCVSQIGAQSSNVARHAALAAGWPEHVPGRDRRAPVRLVRTGAALRRPGGRGRRLRRRRGRRGGGDLAGAGRGRHGPGLRGAVRAACRPPLPRPGRPRARGPGGRGPGPRPGPGAGGARPLRAGQPPAGDGGGGGGALRRGARDAGAPPGHERRGRTGRAGAEGAARDGCWRTRP